MAASVFPLEDRHSLLKTSMAPLTFRNALEVLTNGDAPFPAIKSALSGAKRFIHMEYFP
jgi:phosphatidylserine/phosphatidylglycerophosphate/cardiolipin synthase-like enzyme